MKKMLTLAAAMLLASGSFVQAVDSKKLVSIDSISIMQKSIEGKEVISDIQKDYEKFQDEVKLAQKELSETQESLGKQVKVLSAEAIQEKRDQLAQRTKKLERELAEKDELFRASVQKKQMALRERQQSVINEVFTQEDWGLLIDKNTPGVLCVADAIDETSKVLKVVDEKYQAGKATKAAPKPATLKTAAKDAAPATEKQTIKVA